MTARHSYRIAVSRITLAVVCMTAGFGCKSKTGLTDNQFPTATTTVIAGTPTPPTEGFTLVLLPDTQCYASSGAPYAPPSCGSPPTAVASMMRAQTEWIANNASLYRIAAVVGLGDIVQKGGLDSEWAVADDAYHVLDNAQIPYIAAAGNHDYDSAGSSLAPRGTSKFNQYFGLNRFAGRAWAGASSYPSGKAENSYIEFSVGSDQFLVISLEFFPRDAALEWASDVIAQHPTHRVVVVTHAFLGPDGLRTPTSYNPAPSYFGLTDGNDGEQVWNKLVRKHANIIAVVNGHSGGITSNIGAAMRVDIGDAGNRVVQMLSDYQFSAGGGNGYLRLLNIQPDKSLMIVNTYSPVLDKPLADSANSFVATF